jgi:hypothetical protein
VKEENRQSLANAAPAEKKEKKKIKLQWTD